MIHIISFVTFILIFPDPLLGNKCFSFLFVFCKAKWSVMREKKSMDRSVKILFVWKVLGWKRFEMLEAGMANIIVFLAKQTFRSISIAEPATELINK